MTEAMKSFKVGHDEGEWVPASYNVRWSDGKEYGRWARILRKDSHGLTMIARFVAPRGRPGGSSGVRRNWARRCT